ncbi:MAG TPA: cytochrome c oxidase subunit II [Verrucomicrobiae bacterium]|jgi:cytochrome c oxidase subunit 2
MKSLFATLGLPHDASMQGGGTDNLILAVHILMFVLFAGWISYFIYVLFRFHESRTPKADYEGVKSHASTFLEVLVALIEGALLIALAIPVWARTVDKFPSEKESTVVRIVAQQFQWNAWYPGTNGMFVNADPKFVAGDNLFGFDKSDPNFKYNFIAASDFVVPNKKPVLVYLSSLDVIHSFSCRPLRTMQDAIPGIRFPLHFTPNELGTYQINCAQLCGSGHYAMRGTIKVVSQEDYDKWIAQRSKAGGGAGGGYE